MMILFLYLNDMYTRLNLKLEAAKIKNSDSQNKASNQPCNSQFAICKYLIINTSLRKQIQKNRIKFCTFNLYV
jgi:hypothetical protein